VAHLALPSEKTASAMQCALLVQKSRKNSVAGLGWWTQGKHIGPFGGDAKRAKRCHFSDMNELKTKLKIGR
jgi:hypothetical protein